MTGRVVPRRGGPCGPEHPAGPVVVTAGCIDEEYSRPVVVGDEQLDRPVALRRITGRFDGTDARFNVYLPTEIAWAHRFHQLVYPLLDEHASGADHPRRNRHRAGSAGSAGSAGAGGLR